MMDGYGYGWGFGAGWMMLMPLFWIALLGVIIWAVVRLTQGSGFGARPDSRHEPGRETPQEILDRRLASGEIDVAAYDEARQRLSERGSSRR